MYYGKINSRGYVTNVSDEHDAGYNESLALPEAATTITGFRYKYVDSAWTDGFSGVTDENFMGAYATLQQGWELADIKIAIVPKIKAEAAEQIQALNWKVERAAEVDAATGSTTLAAVYTERAAIRTASNVKETALEALTTMDEIDSFNPTDF